MSEVLKLPEIFKGSWEHLLILTYGADLPFFENAILRGTFRCRNKVILADGQKFLQACDRFARDGLVRMLNQQYVADGLYMPHAAHAKIILLTRQDAGKLLIGSGNLGTQGYTSGGEMFTLYNYNEKSKKHLSAFQTVWELVDTLLVRGVIGSAAERYIRTIYEETPWLMYAPTSDKRLVRHNMDSSFLDQLQDVLKNESVQELWVLAPFYDEKAAALSQLIETFQPQKINVLIQPRHISADREAIQKLMRKYPSKIWVHPFEESNSGDDAYVHAKFYLFKTASKALCLHGSPNCSQVALLLPAPLGNLEAANLLTGERGAFDYLLDNLILQPEVETLDGLDFEYSRPEATPSSDAQPWLLTGAQFQGDKLILHFHGDLPTIEGAKLRIGSVTLDLTAAQAEGRTIRMTLPSRVIETFSGALPPIALETSTFTSSHIFPQHVDSLDREAQMSIGEISDTSLKNFDPEDPEFEALLRELDASFPIDSKSIWRLAGRSTPKDNQNEDDDAYRLSYDEIDFEKLRQHPKILQYTQGTRGFGTSDLRKTRLQQILSAITDHFHGLADLAYKRQPTLALPVNEDPDAENEPEIAPEPEEPRKPVNRNRIRRILKGFIKRYLRGLQSSKFLELVGVDVVVNNYVIFSHILWRLMQKKDWLETDFVIGAFTEMAVFFWGAEERDGYLASLDGETHQRAMDILTEQKSPGLLLAAIFIMNFECMKNSWDDLRLELRDFWRHLLVSQPFELDSTLLLDTWVYLHDAMPYNLPTPGYIVTDLQNLVSVELQTHSLRALEKRLDLPKNCCHIEHASFFQPGLGRSEEVEYLSIANPDALGSFEAALQTLKLWMTYGKRTYHRVMNNRYLIYYDDRNGQGLYHDKESGEEREFGRLKVTKQSWAAKADALAQQGKLADQSIALGKVHISV